eukprot:CAMPEP_0176336758 /NCGR_PEP_ID=MMETSP0121_2-20121125/79283_1 /TAXON_ID=160619 /ORGANISM="Kryptoperidinium foliaceum, Strain CCMP 1326" /LENGTH=37 /DNA_ID= /DNA_START= /DNA_END= /DNA_ORIENTATION=
MALRTAAAVVALALQAGAVELSAETWDAQTAGKSVFV